MRRKDLAPQWAAYARRMAITLGSPTGGGSRPGQPILTPELGPDARIVVEIAWGADPNGNADLWSWTDITGDVYQDPGISFNYGRADFTDTTQPASGSMTLDNSDASYSLGGISPNWPNVKKNVPVRVRIDPNGMGFQVAFQGNIVGFAPSWDTTGEIPIVAVEMAGTMRRLERGGAEVSCPQRYLESVSPAPTIYYPLNDGSLATFGRARIQSAPTQTGVGKAEVRPAFPGASASPYLGQGRIATWLDEGASLKENAIILAFVPLSPFQTTQFVGGVVTSFLSGNGEVGDIWEFGLSEKPSGEITWALVADCAARTVSISDGNSLVVTQNEDILFDGQPHFVQLYSTKVGSDTQFVGFCDGISFISYTATGRAFQHVWSMILFNSSKTERSFAHLASWANGLTPDAHDMAYQMLGANLHTSLQDYTETALYRMAKLRDQTDIQLEIIGDTGSAGDTAVMGVQPTDDIVTLLRDCGVSDQGVLFDGVGPGLIYVAREAIENAAAALTIDVGAEELYPSFSPTHDDARVVNKATAERAYGSKATYEDTDGPLGTASIGTFEGPSLTVSLDSDDAIAHYAGWAVNLGTVEGYRYPSVSLNLAAVPHLAAQVLAVRPGGRIDLINVDQTLTNIGTETIRLVVEGVAMTITPYRWIVTFQCSLFDPWRIITLAADTGDTGEFLCHLDTDGSRLADGVAAGATSLTVETTAGPVWTQAADDFPFYVLVGGIKARVTNVTGATSPQTFTVDPMPVSRPGHSPVQVYNPPVLRL